MCDTVNNELRIISVAGGRDTCRELFDADLALGIGHEVGETLAASGGRRLVEIKVLSGSAGTDRIQFVAFLKRLVEVSGPRRAALARRLRRFAVQVEDFAQRTRTLAELFVAVAVCLVQIPVVESLTVLPSFNPTLLSEPASA